MKSATRILAAVLLSTALGAVVVPAQANAATGTLSGRVVTSNGEPVADATVIIFPATGSFPQSGQTGADGSYRFFTVESGQYTIQISLRNGARQWLHGKKRSDDADRFEVRAGEETVVDETLLPQGNLAGRLVDFDGTPLGGAFVSARDLDGESGVFTQSRADGTWNVDGVFAGRYQVDFHYSNTIQQAAFGKTGKAQADVITVAANTTTRVDDTAVARTRLHVTATNALTGAAVTSFGIFIGPQFGSTDTGDLVLDGIQAGTYDFSAYGDGYFGPTSEITLTAGVPAELSLVLTPVSTITVKVVDAATGEPIRGVCVGAFNRAAAWADDDFCGESTDEAGAMRMSVRAGTYQLLAMPNKFNAPPGYGGQWFGATGGTGRQLFAKSFTVAVGQTLEGPVIKLDRAGTITGHVSTPDGQVPRFGSVNLLSGHPISGSSFGVPIENDGSYTIDFLGPYEWPLLFTASDQAAQWSGQVGDRLFARTVKVTVGGTATYDFRFRAPVNVAFNGLTLLDRVVFYNVITGDIMGVAQGFRQVNVNGPVVGPQLVKLQVWPGNGNQYWVGGDDFAHARLYWIPATGSKTINLG